jgi:ubiquitin-conjugating enzyme E2 O
LEHLVCLSLINTWEGKPEEQWNPSASSIAQFLISVHGIVLAKDPYFMEPGYAKYAGTEEGNLNSSVFNEKALVLVTNVRSIEDFRFTFVLIPYT